MNDVWAWKTVPHGGTSYPIYAWRPGSPFSARIHPKIPTEVEIDEAPMFTVFVSPTKVVGPLKKGDLVRSGGVDEFLWFRSHRDPESYDADVYEVLRKAGLVGEDPLVHTIQVNDDLVGEKFSLYGHLIEAQEDGSVWPLAILAGYTLVKVPDSLDPNEESYELYILDKHRDGEWTQTDLLHRLRSAESSMPRSSDLDLINRHRAKLGQRPLDPVGAGWTEEDVHLEAERVRRLNPLKRRLMR